MAWNGYSCEIIQLALQFVLEVSIVLGDVLYCLYHSSGMQVGCNWFSKDALSNTAVYFSLTINGKGNYFYFAMHHSLYYYKLTFRYSSECADFFSAKQSTGNSLNSNKSLGSRFFETLFKIKL